MTMPSLVEEGSESDIPINDSESDTSVHQSCSLYCSSSPESGELSRRRPGVEATTTIDSVCLDFMDNHSATMIYKEGLYANKSALKKHLGMFVISNHFTFKTRRKSHSLICRRFGT